MVRGLDVFQEYFQDFTDQYVLIGGAACTISFEEQDMNFGRTTKDLDVVLIVEAQTKEFGDRFWQFIHDGGYRNRTKRSGEPQFFRFDKPTDPHFPKMIELFARTEWILDDSTIITPIHIDDSVSSLSAILLSEVYYQALLQGRKIVNGLSVLPPEWIIPFKAKAWLELRDEAGIDSADVKKHRNDIIRLASMLTIEHCEMPDEMKKDMQTFIDEFNVTDEELKNLSIRGVKSSDIKAVLLSTYL